MDPFYPISFFADDVLLFTKAKSSQARIVADLFENFSKASGLKVNLAKFGTFYSSGVIRSKKDKCTSISSIHNTLCLDKYLGFPILKGRPCKVDFNFIIEKMQTRLASWKHRLLNKAGRTTLAKSVLSTIPNYYIQIFWLL